MNRPTRILVLLAMAASVSVSWVQPLSARARAQDASALVDDFQTFWSAARGKPLAEQEALWNRYVEGPRESLYRAVVWEARDHPEWRADRERMLRASFARYPRIAAQIPAEVAEIRSQLRVESVRFRQLFPGGSSAPSAVIVLAPDFDAKSGVLPDGTPVLALAADSLALEKANLRILLPHELFHLYDAEHAGVKNDGVMAGTRLTLPLFAEGLATYVSSVASPGHSDGEYLLQSDLGRLPSSRLPAAARDFLRVADSMTIDPRAHRLCPSFAQWFEGDEKPLNAGYPNRAGYWLGLNLIRRLRRTYSLRQMASWPPAEAQRRMRAALLGMARAGSGGGGSGSSSR